MILCEGSKNNYNPGRGGTGGVGKGEIQHRRRRCSGRGEKETHNLMLWKKNIRHCCVCVFFCCLCAYLLLVYFFRFCLNIISL